MIGRLSGLRRAAARRRAEELLEQFDLTGAARRPARTYSGGMRRRLDVAASLVAAPPVLFLDEPTTGLDPRGRLGLWQVARRAGRQGTSLLLTTQYIEEAERLADTIVIIDRGRVIAAGTPEQLKTRVGGDRLELQVTAGHDPRPLAPRWPASAPANRRRRRRGPGRLPVADGPGACPTWRPGSPTPTCAVSGLALRRPTLEEAFLALTGQPPARPDPARTHDRDGAAMTALIRDRRAPVPPRPAGPGCAGAAPTSPPSPAATCSGWYGCRRCWRSPPSSRCCSCCCSPTRSAAPSTPRRDALHRLPAAWHLRAGHRVRRLPDRRGRRRRPRDRDDRPVPVAADDPLCRPGRPRRRRRRP